MHVPTSTVIMEIRKLLSTAILLLTYLLICCFEEVKGLSIIKFSVPERVPEGSTTQFQCLYDVGHDKLYSIKWYWNETEFYRYEPTSRQPLQLFPIPEINLDSRRSSKEGTNVFVTDLEVGASGIIKCELSADISFLTVTKEKMMTVLEKVKVKVKVKDAPHPVTIAHPENTNIAIFYGSQTGTGEEYSNRLAKEAPRFSMKAKVFDPEECAMEKLSLIPEMIENHLVIFCVATYGEGDPTDNNKAMFELLEEGSESFQGVKYAVFALGNKTYEHYNSAGKYVDKRLAELGGIRVCEIGLGDDDGNIEENFVTWKEKLWQSVCEQYDVSPISETGDTRQFKFTEYKPGEIPDDELYKGEVSRKKPASENQTMVHDAKNPLLAKITTNRNLYKGDRSCMHIEVDIKGTSIKYETGDHLAVYCRAEKDLVNKVGELLDVDLETVMTMEAIDPESSKKTLFPCPTTYRTALTYYVDINQQPTTYILKELSEYTSNEEHKQMLKKMSTYSDEGKAMYAQFIVNSCRNIVHVLEDLPSVKPPIDHLVELLPRLQPRFYSISSSPRVHPDSIHITAVMVDYMQPDNNNRRVKGVCTGFLMTGFHDD